MLFQCLGVMMIVLFSQLAMAQVRIVQWSDAHSTLQTMAQQIQSIDLAAKEFYVEHPQGEFIVYVIGDFTSINPYTQVDKGQLSFEALRLLKKRGYTVLFTPGNHDAFDWSRSLKAELFFQQMKDLHEMGVPVLVANLTKVRKPFRDFVLDHYQLTSLQNSTVILGMTLEKFFDKANLDPQDATPLFRDVEKYEQTLERVLPSLIHLGIERLILGVHEGHERLAQLAEKISGKQKKLKIPLMMGADDHLVSAYKKKKTLIADAGSHGSYNVIDIAFTGEISPVQHVGISAESVSRVNSSIFVEGSVRMNAVTSIEIMQDVEIYNYQQDVLAFVDEVNTRLSRIVGWTQGFATHKYHMKKGRTDLGSLLSEAHVLWARDVFSVDVREPIVAMVNSSSYRIEEPLPEGLLREIDFRRMYPFDNQSAIYRLSGEEIETLFFSRRHEYAEKEKGAYSPQLNFPVREIKKHLEVLVNGEWMKLKKNTNYLTVLDGFLASQLPLKEWRQILSDNASLARKSFQDVLLEYMPQAIRDYEGVHVSFCQELF